MPEKRPVAKSTSAFRTISEVAEQLDVPQHVLRFWETKFSTVRPLKRGGGRRYYRPEDIDLIRQIRNLLYSDGYTIKGVQRLMREGHLKASGSPAPVKVARVPGAAPGATPGALADSASGSAPGSGHVSLGPADLRAVIAELTELRDLLRRAAG